MPKYNIYIICKTEEDFLEKSKDINNKYSSYSYNTLILLIKCFKLYTE